MSKKTRSEVENDTDGNAPFEVKPPVDPVPPPRTRTGVKIDFEPPWRENRWAKKNVETRFTPPADPGAYARSMGLPAGTVAPARVVAPLPGKDNPDEFPYPAAFRAQCEDVEKQLRAIHAKGSSDQKSIWDSLQALSRRKRNGDVAEAGVPVARTVGAFDAFNEAGGFVNAHEAGGEVWTRLLEGAVGDPPVVPGEGLPPTRDARVAFLRLEDGYGYMGNELTPTAVPEAEVCVWSRPKGYENAEGLAVLFVFAWGLDNPQDPRYADVYAGLSGQGVLDYQWSLRGGNRGPSGEPING